MTIKERIDVIDLYDLIESGYPYNTQNQYWFIATIFYKQYCWKYSWKNFLPQLWINKTDTTIPAHVVKDNLVQDIMDVKEILFDYNKTKERDSLAYNKINHMITMLSSVSFINNVIKESIEIFYNN